MQGTIIINRFGKMKQRFKQFFHLQLSVTGIELQTALEERNRARNDASESSLAQDDVVTAAREDRDAAVTRRTKAEIELAKTRVELMQANSELLEAINQKVELSQQLEQWQASIASQHNLRHLAIHINKYLNI